MKKEQITEQAAKELIKGKLSRYFGVAPAEARKEQRFLRVSELGHRELSNQFGLSGRNHPQHSEQGCFFG